MFTVNSRLIITSEEVPFTHKGEEVTVKGQSNTHLLVEDGKSDRFKLEKSGLGTQFMVSFAYAPDLEVDQNMDPDGQTYLLNYEVD